ncbi:MAG: DUF1385 domain-containing protein [Bacteriovoracaceae bacterium]|nr:DUF1385 domain-containing protein [Bacteriovoracaceae bacterium]
MIKKILKKMHLFLGKQYTSIGGQAVIEGVMMRSPNAFVVAVRKPDGSIRLRRDQWFGLSQKLNFLRKPFFRGIVTLVEAMANGVVSLNYSANIAMDEEEKEKALKKGKTLEEYEAAKKKKEKIDIQTFLTIGTSFLFGMGLFVFVPHAATAGLDSAFNLNWDLDGFNFHFVDGIIKACIFILYIWIIGFIPDIRRVFQYHGAEHKSISTFEAGEDLIVENAKKYTTLHPRCGTSFIFFLLFISIILFSVIFTIVPIGQGLPVILKHLSAILFKIVCMFPVAGISYEVIKFAGKHSNNVVCKGLSFPGMMLQKLTTKEPDDQQLEVALASIKAVLSLEEKYNLKEASKKVLTLEEVDIEKLSDIENSNSSLKDFLE